MTRITAAEYRHRFESLRELARGFGLDLFIVTNSDSIYYLTGASHEPLERPFFLFVRPDQEAVLLVPRLEREHMKKAHNIQGDHVRTYSEYPAPEGLGWPERLRELVDGAEEIGVEPSLSLDVSAQLIGLPVQPKPLIERLRLVKSRAEIAMIRRAARYADFAIERLIASSYSGSSVAAGLAETRRVTTRIIREVGDWDPVATRVVMATWAAPRSAMPHSIPDPGDCLREGPHVALALTRVNGYAAECERTYFTEEPSVEMQSAFRAVMEARRLALEALRPGLPCSELDAAVSEFLAQEGYSGEDHVLHRTGHGFGLGNHEPPWIAAGSEDRLSENTVISIEPGLYFDGAGGVRHSDTVLVTEEGYELLTDYPRDIDDLVIRGRRFRARLRGWGVQQALKIRPAHAS